jgi:hypothetical protein
MSDEILVCWRVKDLPVPAKKDSVRGHYCAKCGEELWIMPKNLKLDMPFCCLPCSELLLIEDIAKTGEPSILFPASAAHELTKEQLAKLESEAKKLISTLDN